MQEVASQIRSTVSSLGSSNLNTGKDVMSTPFPPPYATETFSSSSCKEASTSIEASTNFPPVDFFFDPYSFTFYNYKNIG